MALTVGTAGHIDHGKTWLVRALTGKDTDRLPEERERGISIALGYAPLELPDGTQLSLVDVPGHERFVRTMVAGATGIDLFLLVIDAGEGARPQTHEHLADPAAARDRARRGRRDQGRRRGRRDARAGASPRRASSSRAPRWSPSAPRPAPVSTSCAQALARAAATVPPRSSEAQARLYVDRAFTIAGAGTVVTGTLRSGSIARGRRAARRAVRPAHPRPQRPGARPSRSSAPRRGSASRSTCPGISRSQLRPRRRARRARRLSGQLAARRRARGARAGPGRGHGPHRHERRRRPASCARAATPSCGCASRSSPPAATASSCAPRRPSAAASCSTPRRRAASTRPRLELLERGDPESIVRAIVHAPVTGAELQARGLLAPAELAQGLAAVESAGDWFFAPEWLEEQRAGVRARLAERASSSPLDPGIPLGELLPHEPWAPAVLQLLRLERRDGKAYAPGAAPQLGDQAGRGRRARGQARRPEDLVRVDDRNLAGFLEDRGHAEARRRRLRGLGRRSTSAAARRLPGALADHPRRLPRRPRHLAAHRPAAARALRRRRAHPARRRRAAPARSNAALDWTIPTPAGRV